MAHGKELVRDIYLTDDPKEATDLRYESGRFEPLPDGSVHSPDLN